MKYSKLASYFLPGLVPLLLASPRAKAVTIVHSNDILGEIEPCGCRTNPLGGMPRKANFLKRLKDPSLIQLDAGDLLFPTESIPVPLQKQSLLQASYLLKSMEMTGLDAAVPGEKDFSMGLADFLHLTAKSKIKFIAANLKRRNGKTVFPSHVIFKKKDENGKLVRVAVFGIVDDKLDWPKELKASSAIRAARSEVAALRHKADFVVALTHEGFDQDKALAAAVPGIDIIVGGHTQSFLQTPVVVGSTHIYQSSFRNQYVGVIHLTKPLDDSAYQLVGLDPGYDSPAQAPSAVDDLVKEFKTSVAELNSREEARMEASAAPASASDVKFQTFPRCAECHLKQFDFWRKTPHAMAYAALVEAHQDQNKECLSCHTVGFNDPKGWQFVTRLAETRHEGDPDQPFSVADLNTYLKAVHDADSLSSSVKVTPSGESLPLRQSLNKIARSFTPVQCEDCHMPGYDHPFSSGYTGAVAKETCLKCHTPERAPAWYHGNEPDWKTIDAKRAMITCPAGDLPGDEHGSGN